MKKISVFVCAILWLIFLSFSIFAQEFKTIQDGIEYAEMTRGSKEQPVHINLLKLDLTKVRLDVVHALDAAIGTETTSSMATRHGAFAAINAGFFRLDKSIFAGDSAGMLQIDGKLLSESSNDRIAIGIINGKERTEVDFTNLKIESSLKIGRKTLKISGTNRQRKDNELIEYTRDFGITTLTEPNGVEILVVNEKIQEIFKEKGSTPIPVNGTVLSASGKMKEDILRLAKSGGKVQLYRTRKMTIQIVSHTSNNQNFAIFEKAEDITNGVPQLIKNGKIEITWEQEKSSKEFVETRHPRTAVAKLKDGKFLMVTVDGRQPDFSVGMNLNELAAFLLEQGATDAMNLDGGGSTTMFLDGKIVNKPSDKEGERRVSDVILVTPRKKISPRTNTK